MKSDEIIAKIKALHVRAEDWLNGFEAGTKNVSDRYDAALSGKGAPPMPENPFLIEANKWQEVFDDQRLKETSKREKQSVVDLMYNVAAGPNARTCHDNPHPDAENDQSPS